MVSNWPPALQAALARWGATQGKSPALTALDITGRPLYTLTYGDAQGFSDQLKKRKKKRCSDWTFVSPGKLWSRSVKLAYTLLNKLGTKNEQILKPGDRVGAECRQACRRRRVDPVVALAGGLGVSQQ